MNIAPTPLIWNRTELKSLLLFSTLVRMNRWTCDFDFPYRLCCRGEERLITRNMGAVKCQDDDDVLSGTSKGKEACLLSQTPASLAHPSIIGGGERETVNSTVRWDISHQGVDTQSKVINFCRLPYRTDWAESQSSGRMNKHACRLQIRRLGSDFTYSCFASRLYSSRGWIHPPPLWSESLWSWLCLCEVSPYFKISNDNGSFMSMLHMNTSLHLIMWQGVGLQHAAIIKIYL